MSKLDEFKVFIKDQEEVLDKIHKGELTWQKVYEIYEVVHFMQFNTRTLLLNFTRSGTRLERTSPSAGVF